MISGKELTLDEILKEIKKIKYQLYLTADRYVRSQIHLKGITWKDIVTKGGRVSDKMSDTLIKKEELGEEIASKIDSYNEYRNLAIDKINEMIETQTDAEVIFFLKETMNWKWKEIATVMNCSISTCKRRFREKKND